MSRKLFDLIVVVTITILGVALIFTGVSNVVARVIFALPLVLILPGYALTAALLPGATPQIMERLTLNLGLSLAIATVGGLVLNWTPWGLRAESWAIFLGGITIGASMVAVMRRRGRFVVVTKSVYVGLGARQVLLLGLATGLAAAALMLARIGALHQPTTGITQLWILPDNETNFHSVRVGVHNLESESIRYKLQVDVGNHVVNEWVPVELGPGQKWEQTVVLPVNNDARTVEARLYHLDVPEMPYRWVMLWLDK